MSIGAWSDSIRRDAEEMLGSVVELRRAIHAEPEVGLHLPNTQQKVLAALEGLGLEARCGKDASYIVAVLRGGRPGPCVLLRADMDALALQEESGVEFASRTPGCMHACGHDAHTAMLVGAARLLAARRAEMAGTVVFFFEAGEEGRHGARVAIDEGLLEGPDRPHSAFAIHVAPSLPAGSVATRPGVIMAASTTLRFAVRGRGAHAAFPHRSIDPVPAACEVVSAFRGLTAEEGNAYSPAVLTVTALKTSTQLTNVIPDEVSGVATLRTTAADDAKRLTARALQVGQEVVSSWGPTFDMEVIPIYPLTSNDPASAALVAGVAGSVAGKSIPLESPWATSEDFGYILQKVPGAMALLGVAPSDGGESELHSPRLRIDENALSAGVALYAGVALASLQR